MSEKSFKKRKNWKTIKNHIFERFKSQPPERVVLVNLGLIIFDGDGYSNGHKSQKNNFQIYLDPPQIDWKSPKRPKINKINIVRSLWKLVWWVIGVPKTLRVIKCPRKRSILHRLGFIAQKHQFFDVFVIFPKKPNFWKIFDYISKTVRDRAFLRPFDDP